MKKNIRFDILVLVLVSLAALAVIQSDLNKMSALVKKNSDLSASLADGKKEQAFLKKRLSGMNDKNIIEISARQKLGLVKKGETPYKIVYNKK